MRLSGGSAGSLCPHEIHRAILERLPEGDEDDHKVFVRTADEAEIDDAADDCGDDGGE